MSFAGDVTMLDVTNGALGDLTEMGDYFPFEDSTHLRQVFPSSVTAIHGHGVVTFDYQAFQRTPLADVGFTAAAQPDVLLPEMTYPTLSGIQAQEAPVIYDPSDACGNTTNNNHMIGMASATQTQYVTSEDWDRNRALFTRLYRDENKTLKEVKSIMKDQYGFNATNKMYSKRINDWKLHKNCKSSEKDAILRRVDTNMKLGVDLGDPMLHGRTVKVHVLERHRKEKRKARSPSPNAGYQSAVAPSDGRSAKRACPQALARSASISFSRIDDPADYRNCENLLFQVGQYYYSKLEKDPHATWHAWRMSCKGGKLKITYTFQDSDYTCTFNGSANTVFGRYESAITCLEEGHAREGWRMIQEGAEMVRPLLLQEPDEILSALLELISNQRSSRYFDVKKQLLTLLSGMAIIIHGERHPISNACRLLEALHTKQHVLELASRKIRDVLKHRLGEDHTASLEAQNQICRNLVEQRRYDEAERSLRDLVEICERFCGRNAYRTRSALFGLAYLCYVMSRDSEAEEINEDLIQRCIECGKADGLYAFARNTQALICLNREDYLAAEEHSWSALSSRLLHWGPEDPFTTNLWVEYQRIGRRRQAYHGMYMPVPQNPHTLCDVSDEPIPTFSRPRSSSLPRMDDDDWVAGFWSKTLLGPESMVCQPSDLKRRSSLPSLGILETP